MATLAEIRAQYPQYSDLSDEQLADGLHRKHYADMPRDEFDAKISFRRKSALTTADTLVDVGEQTVRGFNRGLNDLVSLPGKVVAGAINLVSPGSGERFRWNNPVSEILSSPNAKPQTDAGRYADASGRALGASAVPSAAILGNAGRMAALTPTTTARATARAIGQAVAARPGAALAADAAAAIGSGTGQQFAEDEGFGPTGQMVGGMLGGAAPIAVASGASRTMRGLRGLSARSDPYARVAAGLGDGSVDDLASGIATGATTAHHDTNRRALDVLGQEMVRTNGDRAAAVQSTIARMMAEDGISLSTAQQRLRSLAAVHRDSDLFLGEYPAVAAGNQATRLRQAQNITDEAAGRIDDVGTHWEIDNVANAFTGPSTQRVRNAVTNRYDQLAESTRRTVQSLAPNGQTIRDAENLIQQARRLASADYRQVHSAQGNVNYGMLHGLLRRVVDRHTQRMYGRSGEQFDALEDGINSLYTTVPVGSSIRNRAAQPGIEDQVAAARRAVREARRNRLPRDQIVALERQADDLAENMRLNRRGMNPQAQQILMPSLQELQDMRGGIRGMITAARQSGNDHIVSTLQPLYGDLTRIMERASPQWAAANRRWGDMRLDEVAQELGDAMSRTAGPRFREQLEEFQQLAPQAQNIVRIHFAQKLLDMIENAAKQGRMINLAQQFASGHMRQMVRTVLGDEPAVRLVRLIRDHNVAAKSAQMLGGSPTQPRLARQQNNDIDLGLLASVDQASVSGIRKFLMDWTINRLKERRNRVVGQVVTTPMRDMAGVAENIERMRLARVRAVEADRRPVRGIFGLAGHIGGVMSGGEERPSPPLGMLRPIRRGDEPVRGMLRPLGGWTP